MLRARALKREFFLLFFFWGGVRVRGRGARDSAMGGIEREARGS